jgi:hypothetical protein
MAANGETLLRTQQERVPHPGTEAHMEYLFTLDLDPDEPLAIPRIFFAETMAATSIARMIKKLHTPQAFQYQNQAIINTRLIKLAGGPLPDFRGYIDLPPSYHFGNSPSRSKRRDSPETVLSAMESPLPRSLVINAQPTSKYSFDAVIPMTRANLYDPTRPLKASYRLNNYRTESGKVLKYKELIYDEAAQPRKTKIDPEESYYEYHSWVPPVVIQEAAGVLLVVAQRLRQELQEQVQYPEVEVSWHPDYLADEPDEFVDDPDEFLKKPREQW